jgi:hypothetical protein
MPRDNDDAHTRASVPCSPPAASCRKSSVITSRVVNARCKPRHSCYRKYQVRNTRTWFAALSHTQCDNKRQPNEATDPAQTLLRVSCPRARALTHAYIHTHTHTHTVVHTQTNIRNRHTHTVFVTAAGRGLASFTRRRSRRSRAQQLITQHAVSCEIRTLDQTSQSGTSRARRLHRSQAPPGTA